MMTVNCPGQDWVRTRASSLARYYVPRELHSVEALVNNRGHEVERYTYDAYGLPVITLISALDVNYDGIVDRQDDSLIYSNQGQDPSVVGPIYDTNGDGQIDIWDQIPCPPPPALVSSPVSGVGNPYAFTGRRMDRIIKNNMAALLLYHYRAREYDPHHGRFLQRDPAEYVDGMSLYEYVRSNPGARSDPHGLYGEETHKVLTSKVAESVGFKKKYAEKTGEADISVDGLIGPTGWFLWGLDWHFDIDTEGGSKRSAWDTNDSRYRDSEQQRDKAVRLCAHESGKEDQAVWELGRGLHPIQDFYAHGNWRVWFFPSPIPLRHPAWYDDPNKDGSGPGGIPLQDPDDVWSEGTYGTRRYTTMRGHTKEYLRRFLQEVRKSRGTNARCCLKEVLKSP